MSGKKKKAAALAAILALCLTGTGCGEKEQKEPVTITVWHYYNDEIKASFDKMVQQFNETVGAEKGIIVDAYSQGGVNELADAVYAAANGDIGANPMPDIFAAYSDSAYRMDKLGVVASLDSYFTDEELSKYRPEFLEDGRFSEDGTLKIIPVAKSTELMYINKTAFDKFASETGADLHDLSTWEGVARTAQKYYEWGGQAFFGIDSMPNFMIQSARQLGQDIFTVEGGQASFRLSEENARKIWDTYYVPYISGHYLSSGRFRSDDVKSGLIAAFIGSNSSATYFPKKIEMSKDSSYDIESYVLPYPHYEGRDGYCVQQGAGMVVAKSAPEKEAACVEFLKWFTDPQQNLDFAASTSYMPVQNEAMTYDSTVKALGVSDEKDVRVQTAKALYDMLADYTLYSSRPFTQSFDARNTLDDSLTALLQADTELLNSRVENGETREAVCEELTGQKHFEEWYTSLVEAMNNLLNS